MSHDTDFERWLAEATRGLPRKPARAVQVELAAHYEDALDDHAGRGLEGVEARRLALAGMGPARDVARGLLEAHVGRSQYRVAAWLCLWNLLMQPVIHAALNIELVTIPAKLFAFVSIFALFFPTMVVLEAVRSLLEWRLDVRHGRLVATLTMVQTAMFAVSLGLGIFTPAGVDTPMIPIIRGNLASGAVVGAVALLWLAAAAHRYRDRLAGLGKPLTLVTALVALGQVALMFGAVPPLKEAARYGYMVLAAAYVALWPTLMLLFFRLGYRRHLDPMLPA